MSISSPAIIGNPAFNWNCAFRASCVGPDRVVEKGNAALMSCWWNVCGLLNAGSGSEDAFTVLVKHIIDSHHFCILSWAVKSKLILMIKTKVHVLLKSVRWLWIKFVQDSELLWLSPSCSRAQLVSVYIWLHCISEHWFTQTLDALHCMYNYIIILQYCAVW